VKEKINNLKNSTTLFLLRLRYGIKTLPPAPKTLFSLLLALLALNLFALIYQINKRLVIEVPSKGGSLTEGIIGTPRFINPVLAISDADRDLTSLIYSGLMRPDEEGKLIPDLAEKYEITDGDLCYAFTLKTGIKWPDNEPITTDDVIFTVDLIKNPQTKSPKRASFEGVDIQKIDEKNFKFCLPSPYAPFLENTTVGILPRHIWGEILPEQMPLSDFNIKAAGSGPYQIKKTIRNSSGIITSISLEPNKKFALQRPLIENLTLKFYPSEKKLIEAYQKNEIESLNSVSPKTAYEIQKENSEIKSFPLPRIFAVFFNQDMSPVFADKEVRNALNIAADRTRVIKEVLENLGNKIKGPLPENIYDIYLSTTTEKTESVEEPNREGRIAEAKKILEKAGWTQNSEGVFEKSKDKNTKIKLEFSLATSNIEDLVKTANLIKEDWEKMGAKVNVKTYEIGDLEQNIIRARKYDALLFGEVMGRDPDPFAFWHSSQRNDPGLNIALYANITADKLLEAARTAANQKERAEKYIEFQKIVEKDIPAVFLYSPHFVYIIPKTIKNLKEIPITVSAERFSQIYKWHTETRTTWKIFEENKE
jgi:peptide/nickel transport system substrate-binding protein